MSHITNNEQEKEGCSIHLDNVIPWLVETEINYFYPVQKQKPLADQVSFDKAGLFLFLLIETGFSICCKTCL